VNELEGHPRSLNCCYLTSHTSLPISGLHVSILHCFQEITTSTVYVTDCDLEKSSRIDKTAQITSHVWFPIHIQFTRKQIVVNSMIFFCITGVRKVSNNITFLSSTLAIGIQAICGRLIPGFVFLHFLICCS